MRVDSAACANQCEGCAHSETCVPTDVRTGRCLWEGSRVYPVRKIFNPDGFKFPSYKDRQGWAVMKCLGTGIWYFVTGNIFFKSNLYILQIHRYLKKQVKTKTSACSFSHCTL